MCHPYPVVPAALLACFRITIGTEDWSDLHSLLTINVHVQVLVVPRVNGQNIEANPDLVVCTKPCPLTGEA
jgi:hypothetical protein